MNETRKILYAVDAEQTSTIEFKETDTVFDVLCKIQEKEGDDGYNYIFFEGARIQNENIFYDYYDPKTVYIVTKTLNIPKELNSWSDNDQPTNDGCSNKKHKMIYAVNTERTSMIMFKETDTVSDVLRKIQKKEGDDGYNYLFFEGAQIQNEDIFYDYYDPAYVYVSTKSQDFPMFMYP